MKKAYPTLFSDVEINSEFNPKGKKNKWMKF